MASPPRTDLLQWDEENDEPYMLIPRFPDLRLTPWRESDSDTAVKLFNDPSIAKYSFRRPYPYLAEHLDWMRQNIVPASAQTAAILRPLLLPPAGSPSPSHPLPTPTGPVPFFPFLIVRHHPSGQMIGDFLLIQPQDAIGGGAVPANEQTWELVYNLFPEWTGKGIAGAVLDVVLAGWVSWVGIGKVMAGAETANAGSAGLVKSRGFVKAKTFLEQWPEEKGGGEREISHYELRMADYKSRLI